VQSKGWYDVSGKGFKKHIGKGKHLIIVHAGGETVFVPNGLLISIRYLNHLVQWWTKKKPVHLNFSQIKIVKKDK
jgi:hypothetical protein